VDSARELCQKAGRPLIIQVFRPKYLRAGRPVFFKVTAVFVFMSDAAKARSASQSSDFLKTATEKFPQWDENAKAFLKELNKRHAQKPITKGLDHFLMRYLGEMHDKAKSPRKRKPEAEPAAVPAVASDKPAAKQVDKPAIAKSKDTEDDPLLEDVSASLLARSAEDNEESREHGNKTLAEICQEIWADTSLTVVRESGREIS